MGFWAALLPRRHGRVYKTSAMAHAHPRKAGVVRSTLAKRPCARARMRKWLLGLAAVLLVPSGSHEAVHDRSGPRFTRRPHGIRVPVDRRTVRVMDGDSAEIRWSPADVETVRVLGIDTPELFDRNRGEPESRNTAGYEGRGFARGAFAVARSVELARAEELDRYGRTLGYVYRSSDGLFLNLQMVADGYAHAMPIAPKFFSNSNGSRAGLGAIGRSSAGSAE